MNWQETHELAVSVAGAKAALDWEQGRVMLSALRAEVHRHLGYATYVEYVERVFGLSPRETAERLRVARALEGLPRMAEALRSGGVCWSAVRELSRVAIAETEEAWLSAAADRTVRQIEELVSRRQQGDLPDDPPSPDVRRHVLRFEVAQLRHELGGTLDEDEAFLMMARQVLGGPKDAGRSNYQVAVTVCSACGQGFQHGRGETIAIGDEIVEMAQCDAQHIGEVSGPTWGRSGARRNRFRRLCGAKSCAATAGAARCQAVAAQCFSTFTT